LASNAQTIERIRSLLIKAKPQSGATEAERAGAQQMAFKLMEKHGITKEQLVTAPSPQQKTQQKPRPQQKPTGNGWHTHTIRPAFTSMKSIQMLLIEMNKISREQKWFEFRVDYNPKTGFATVYCNNTEVMKQYYKLYEKCLIDEQLNKLKELERDRELDAYRRKVEKETLERRKAENFVANVQKMVVVGIMILIMVVAFIL
jgi:hypothetical protein